MRLLLLRTAIAVALLTLGAALRVCPGRTLRHVRAIPRRTTGSGFLTLTQLTAAVSGVGVVPGLRGTCLTRAVTILLLGRLLGLDPSLTIGVRRHGRALAAHAWIEGDGETAPPQDVSAYVRLWSTA